MVFPISEFCAVCGITDSGVNYKDIKDTLLDLATPFGFIGIGNETIKGISWIEKPVIDLSNGSVEIMFDAL